MTFAAKCHDMAFLLARACVFFVCGRGLHENVQAPFRLTIGYLFWHGTTTATSVFGFTMGFLMVVVVVVVVVVVTLKQQKSALQQGIPEVARWLLTTTTATTTKNAMLESLARQGFSLSRW